MLKSLHPKPENRTLYFESLGLSVGYGLCVFLFFRILFPCHLHYQEQFQLFLFTKNYFFETCSHPGGFCNYAGRFFTQFYNSSVIGALLVSCLLISIQQLVYTITRRFSKHSAGLFVSFLPSLFYWYLLCNEDTQTGGIVALLFTLIITLAGTFPTSRSVSRIYLFTSIPVLYWLAGGTVILSTLLLVYYSFLLPSLRLTSHDLSQTVLKKREDDPSLSNEGSLLLNMDRKKCFLGLLAICFTLSLPFISKHFLKQYPLIRYWWGSDYVHFVNNPPYIIHYLWAMIFIIVVGINFLPNLKYQNRKLKPQTAKSPKKSKSISQFLNFSFIQPLALMFVIYFVIIKNAYPQNLSKEEIMAYDYHCKMQNWDRIIEMANRKSPAVPMTVTCLNLALYKTGQLSDVMFHYFQNGPEGLLPSFQRDFMIPMVGGEPYYYLGFVNTAQRFAFEAMEALPDFQKSVRSIKRLAETNLINGYYEVASKYLSILENTLFYKNWAKETRKFLHNDVMIQSHPEWGEIRRFQTTNDFLFSSREINKILGIYFQQNTDHRMAYEYLMAYVLLTKDIQNFPVYFQWEKDFSYKEIPKSYQEALAYIWGLNYSNTDDFPFPLNQSVKQAVISYANIYTSIQLPEPILRNQFSKTYWYYLHFRDYKLPNTEINLQY